MVEEGMQNLGENVFFCKRLYTPLRFLAKPIQTRAFNRMLRVPPRNFTEPNEPTLSEKSAVLGTFYSYFENPPPSYKEC